jgi:TRAP-type C4-dicarboxylate transport system permease small subunit
MSNDFPPAGGALRRTLNAADYAIGLLERAMVVMAVAALFAIMLLIFFDAGLRYAFSRPLSFTTDLVTLYLMSAGMLLTLGWTLRQGGHIAVDLFVHWMPERLYHLVIGLMLLLSNVVVTFIAYQISLRTIDSLHNHELTVGIYAWQLWISKGIVAFSMAGLSIRILHVGISNILAALTGDRTLAIPVSPPPNELAEEAI